MPYCSVTYRFSARMEIGASMLPRRQAGSRAHAPTYGGERVGRARDEERFAVAAGGDQLHVAARIGPHRTPGLTLDLVFPVLQIGKLNA
ncbi:MAG TPA: hypothetical protein VES67_04155 [Vicinamibacterales bacterium]|nr:hypothetical protein [Vicinamibacterales bacterium]